MTAQDLLDQIQEDLENPWKAVDVRALLAALRAVLDNHWCIEGGEECGYDGRLWPCPDYRAITDALSGVTTRTDR